MVRVRHSDKRLQMIENLDGTTRLAELGTESLADGTKLPLPPVLLGQIGQDPEKKTVLIYGHLDVQPAKKVSMSYHGLMITQFVLLINQCVLH